MKFKSIYLFVQMIEVKRVQEKVVVLWGMDLRKELVKMINDNGLKGKVRANKSGCLDVCEHGPAVVIYPEGHWYLGVEKKDLKEFLILLFLAINQHQINCR